jgi:hypothetical protein
MSIIVSDCPCIFFNVYYKKDTIQPDNIPKSLKNIRLLFGYKHMPADLQEYMNNMFEVEEELDGPTLEMIIYNICLINTFKKIIHEKLDNLILIPGNSFYRIPMVDEYEIEDCDLLFLNHELSFDYKDRPVIRSNNAVYFKSYHIIEELFNLMISTPKIIGLDYYLNKLAPNYHVVLKKWVENPK